jgi:hypothetical protein
MNPPITIDIQNEYLDHLFTRSGARHELTNLVAYLEELLSLGAVARLVQKNAVLKEFKSPGQFDDYVKVVMASFRRGEFQPGFPMNPQRPLVR